MQIDPKLRHSHYKFMSLTSCKGGTEMDIGTGLSLSIHIFIPQKQPARDVL